MAANSRRQLAPGTLETTVDGDYSDSASEFSVEMQWDIFYPSLKKSDKELRDIAEYQDFPYSMEMISAKSLNHHYIVEPAQEWDHLRKYRKFQCK